MSARGIDVERKIEREREGISSKHRVSVQRQLLKSLANNVGAFKWTVEKQLQ